eukprot:2969537-Lingulodinium_polyedra.AAC.1
MAAALLRGIGRCGRPAPCRPPDLPPPAHWGQPAPSLAHPRGGGFCRSKDLPSAAARGEGRRRRAPLLERGGLLGPPPLRVFGRRACGRGTFCVLASSGFR